MGGDPTRTSVNRMSRFPANYEPGYDVGLTHGDTKTVKDPKELENLVNALRRIGVFDLALPPENFRPNPQTTYVLPGAASMYGTEQLQL
jgi:hypothetical protein